MKVKGEKKLDFDETASTLRALLFVFQLIFFKKTWALKITQKTG
jgi:hypothetical protein